MSPVLKIFSGDRLESVFQTAASVGLHGFLALEILQRADEKLPQRLDVRPLGAQIADRHAQRVAAAEDGVGKEDGAGGVDAREEPLVEVVLLLGRTFEAGAKADGAEGHR